MSGSRKKFFLILLVPALGAALAGGASLAGSTAFRQKPPMEMPSGPPLGLELIDEVMEIARSQYVTEPDRGKMVRDALAGMVGGLDPYSAYLTPELLDEEEGWIDGSFVGIGIEVAPEGRGITIITPIEGGSARKAGILAGDVIEEINGDPVAEMSYDEAMVKLRGPEDTRIDLGIRRGEEEKLRNYKLARVKINLRSVYLESAGGVDIIRLTSFQRTTVEEFTKAIDELREKGGLKGLVLDLRDNPGGLVDQAVKVADIFLKEGTIVSTKGRVERENALYVARREGSEPDWPLAVIINRGSASAAEILAGALKDRGRGLVTGEKSFGKGSVQSIIDLSDGSALRLTTAHYFTPSGTSIHKNGIPPDVVAQWQRGGEDAPGDSSESFEGAGNFKGYDLEGDPQLKTAVTLLLEGRCPTFETAWVQ
ncbi:S41 family peptidase [bacterium]|nr:MAG: S41 family peptidase [bacterium]